MLFTLIDRSSGSSQLLQRVLRLLPGASIHVGHWVADDVLYVIQGQGRLWTEDGNQTFDVRPGFSAVVPQESSAFLTNLSKAVMEVVSVLSPLPMEGVIHAEGRGDPIMVLHEDDQEDLPAGDDRHFRLLIEPKHGARNVTQFVGFIERSRAPLHTHAYEEAIYILEGEGIVHIEDQRTPILPGTSIFLPPGTPHCLENAGPTTLKLLGVFSPPGSPAAREQRT